MDESSCNFCQSVREWIKRPFNDKGTVLDWFLFVGLIGALSWLWSRIVARIAV